MQWIQLTSEQQLSELISKSESRPQVIFKHSTRCSISAVAMQRLQKSEKPSEMDFYFLDLIAYRSLSNLVAQKFGVTHESPQVLIIKNGQSVYDESHLSISMDEIIDQATAA